MGSTIQRLLLLLNLALLLVMLGSVLMVVGWLRWAHLMRWIPWAP